MQAMPRHYFHVIATSMHLPSARSLLTIATAWISWDVLSLMTGQHTYLDIVASTSTAVDRRRCLLQS